MSPGQSWEVVCAAASFKSALANFSELNVWVGFQFYINVILGNNSVQYSKKFPLSRLFFLENIALRRLFVYCERLYCPLKVAPIILQYFFFFFFFKGFWLNYMKRRLPLMSFGLSISKNLSSVCAFGILNRILERWELLGGSQYLVISK